MTIIENLQLLFQGGKAFTEKELLSTLALSEQDTKRCSKRSNMLSRE